MGGLLIGIGVFLCLIGGFAGVYQVSTSHIWGLYSTASNPYASFTIPLIIGGIVMIVVGAVLNTRK